MVTIEFEFVTAISVAGLILSIVSFTYTYWRATRGNVKELENRLTKLEGNIFTDTDRRCLTQLEMKMSLFWNIVEKEFPKMLVKANTPALDLMLRKISEAGFKGLTRQEAQDAYLLLDEQYREASENEEGDTGRKTVLAFLKGALALEWSLTTSETQICQALK